MFRLLFNSEGVYFGALGFGGSLFRFFNDGEFREMVLSHLDVKGPYWVVIEEGGDYLRLAGILQEKGLWFRVVRRVRGWDFAVSWGSLWAWVLSGISVWCLGMLIWVFVSGLGVDVRTSLAGLEDQILAVGEIQGERVDLNSSGKRVGDFFEALFPLPFEMQQFYWEGNRVHLFGVLSESDYLAFESWVSVVSGLASVGEGSWVKAVGNDRFGVAMELGIYGMED